MRQLLKIHKCEHIITMEHYEFKNKQECKPSEDIKESTQGHADIIMKSISKKEVILYKINYHTQN